MKTIEEVLDFLDNHLKKERFYRKSLDEEGNGEAIELLKLLSAAAIIALEKVKQFIIDNKKL